MRPAETAAWCPKFRESESTLNRLSEAAILSQSSNVLSRLPSSTITISKSSSHAAAAAVIRRYNSSTPCSSLYAGVTMEII